MTTSIESRYRVWPFQTSKQDIQKFGIAEKIAFLEGSHAKGFEAYWMPQGYEYGANTQSRSGCTVQLIYESIWELILKENSNRRLTAFTDNFQIAGQAIISWLSGQSSENILENIDKYLIVPPELSYSHKIYDADTSSHRQYWPFAITKAENQFPEEIEKIEFLKNVYDDSFAAYRMVEEWDHYGVESESRSGIVIRRGIKNRWEFRLYAEGKGTQLTAFVTSFEVSGTALRAWLNGRSVSEILEDINKHLAVLPGKERSSYKVYTAESKS
jgi:hypothetical protein